MRTWVDHFAQAAGVDAPDDETIAALLALAATAAHAAERTAAPITCWLTAAAGISTERARTIADELAATLGEP